MILTFIGLKNSIVTIVKFPTLLFEQQLFTSLGNKKQCP